MFIICMGLVFFGIIIGSIAEALQVHFPNSRLNLFSQLSYKLCTRRCPTTQALP